MKAPIAWRHPHSSRLERVLPRRIFFIPFPLSAELAIEPPVTSLIVRIVALAAALPVAIFSSSLLAQENGSAVSPVLQVQRPKGADQLGNYLTRLAANPRDVDALIGAGESNRKSTRLNSSH